MEVNFAVTPVFTGIENHAVLNNDFQKAYLFKMYWPIRNDFVDVFNERIDDINKKWEEFVLNEHLSEDDNAAPNSRYHRFIKSHLKNDLRHFNNNLPVRVKNTMTLELDEYCCIIGRLTLFPDVTINLELKEV